MEVGSLLDSRFSILGADGLQRLVGEAILHASTLHTLLGSRLHADFLGTDGPESGLYTVQTRRKGFWWILAVDC